LLFKIADSPCKTLVLEVDKDLKAKRVRFSIIIVYFMATASLGKTKFHHSWPPWKKILLAIPGKIHYWLPLEKKLPTPIFAI